MRSPYCDGEHRRLDALHTSSFHALPDGTAYRPGLATRTSLRSSTHSAAEALLRRVMLDACRQAPHPSCYDARVIRARSLAFLLASAVPFVFYVATSSGFGYWLDSGELVAASTGLGIAHPPGESFAALIGAVFTWLPLGPLPFRVALASALLGSLAAGFLCLAASHSLRSIGIRSELVQLGLGFAVSTLTASTAGWWFQSIRPEVYALSAATSFVAIERALAFETRGPNEGDVRALYVAALATGLGLTNHHLLTVVVSIALIPVLFRAWKRLGLGPIVRSSGFLVLGLVVDLYLPVRASAAPALNLGQPDSLDRFWWVVTAQTFQKNTGFEISQPLIDRAAQVAEHLIETVPVPILVMALVGAYLVVRTAGARSAGILWLLVVVGHGLMRTWLGFVRHNPDAAGYLMPMVASVFALAALPFGFVALRLSSRAATVVTLLLGAASVVSLPYGVSTSSLASFTATDAFDEVGRLLLPPRAVVLAHNPQTIFRHWGGEAVDRTRPDVLIVPIPLISYPEMANTLAREAPEIAGVLRAELLDGRLSVSELQSLAAERPVLVELDVRVPPDVQEVLVPGVHYYEVLTDSATADDRRLAARVQRRGRRNLLALLGAPPHDYDTQGHLLWMHYMDALYWAGAGNANEGLNAVRQGLAINPEAQELRALDETLRRPGQTGPIDIRPFLPR